MFHQHIALFRALTATAAWKRKAGQGSARSLNNYTSGMCLYA